MRKKIKLVNCLKCGKIFDNAYRKTKWTKLCCSRICARDARIKSYIVANREERHRLRAEGRCIICKEKVTPIVVIHQLCSKHKEKNAQKK